MQSIKVVKIESLLELIFIVFRNNLFLLYNCKYLKKMIKKFSENEKSEIIELALSDHVSFENIKAIYGIGEKDVKKFMRANLKPNSYKAWRKRVREFSDRRQNYK